LAHSWGLNVLEQGLGALGASLAARILGVSPGQYITNHLVTPTQALIVGVPLDTAPDSPYAFALRGTGGAHFPYGLDVVPDVPM